MCSAAACDLLDSGARLVWVLYPDTREIQIVTADSEQWLVDKEELICLELLPELQLPVAAFF